MRVHKIPVGSHHRALVDEEDFALVSGFVWHLRARNNGRNLYAETGAHVLMHRLILKAPDGVIVDHIDCDGLNNRRANLRKCGWDTNNRNRRKMTGTSSRFKGVTRERSYWKAYIYLSQRRVHLGIFDSEECAAVAYNEAARMHFGDVARLNEV